MPASACPHCQTQLWVRDVQLNMSQGFVFCSHCDSLFKAREYLINLPTNTKPEELSTAITNAHLLMQIGHKMKNKTVVTPEQLTQIVAEVQAEVRGEDDDDLFPVLPQHLQEKQAKAKAEQERIKQEQEKAKQEEATRLAQAKQEEAARLAKIKQEEAKKLAQEKQAKKVARAQAKSTSTTPLPQTSTEQSSNESHPPVIIKKETDWTMLVIIALIMLMMQLFYLLLLK